MSNGARALVVAESTIVLAMIGIAVAGASFGEGLSFLADWNWMTSRLLNQAASRYLPMVIIIIIITVLLSLQFMVTWLVFRRAKALAKETESVKKDLAAETAKRRATEKELWLRQEFIRQFFAAAPAGLAVLDADLRYVQVNDKLAQIHRESPEDHLGKSVYDLQHSILEPGEAILETVLATGEPKLDLELAAGGRQWSASLFPIKGEDEVIIGVGQIVVDVTERKHAEDALRESEQRFRELFENASDIIYTIDLDGNFTSINKAAERATGYSLAESLTMNIKDIVVPDELPAVADRLESQLGGEPPKIFETTVIAKHGRRISMEVSNRLRFREGAPVGFQGMARDISARKRDDLLKQDRRLALEMVAQNRSLTEIFNHLIGMVERQYEEAIGSISLVLNGHLRIVAAPGLQKSFIAALDGKAVVQTDRNPGALCAYRRQTVTITDIAQDPDFEEYRSVALGHNLRACVAVPIMSGGGGLFGTFEVHYPAAHDPDENELGLLEMAASVAAIASEHKQLTDNLAYLAHHDPLTGLPNRLLFEDRLQHAMAEARRHGRIVALLYVDVDRFKLINDNLGHSVGDRLLKKIAKRFRLCLRESDTLARIGGDEFNVVLTQVGSFQEVAVVAGRLLSSLQKPFHIGPNELFVTASIGISLYPEDGEDIASLERHADSAMFAAKNKGGAKVQRYSVEMRIGAAERLELENDLRRALERGQLTLHYQPQFDLVTGKVDGLEALLRWTHPELGPIPPDRFIPVAEESGLIMPISDWVLNEACRQNQCWQRHGFKPVKIALNVSASQFARSELIGKVADALWKYHLDPGCLELELTESLIIRDVEESLRQMNSLRILGISISIDDFGTGYSSLKYLQSLPVDNLKIDQSFLQVLDETGDTEPVVHTIVTLAHSLKMTVTAEGVETEAQLVALRKMGCDKVQGFWVGKPMPPKAVEEFLTFAMPAPSGNGHSFAPGCALQDQSAPHDFNVFLTK